MSMMSYPPSPPSQRQKSEPECAAICEQMVKVLQFKSRILYSVHMPGVRT